MLFTVFILGICSLLVNNGVNGGNNVAPYWVHVTGFQGAGSVGQDASANGYAGSSLVSPLSASGFNSPLAPSGGGSLNNPATAGFAGYGNKGGGSTVPVAGGQGNLPYGGR